MSHPQTNPKPKDKRTFIRTLVLFISKNFIFEKMTVRIASPEKPTYHGSFLSIMIL